MFLRVVDPFAVLGLDAGLNFSVGCAAILIRRYIAEFDDRKRHEQRHRHCPTGPAFAGNAAYRWPLSPAGCFELFGHELGFRNADRKSTRLNSSHANISY